VERLTVVTDEAARLRRDATIVVPSGKLQIRHTPSRNEVMWSSTGSLDSPGEQDVAAVQHSWEVVSDTLKRQYRDFMQVRTAVEARVEADGTFDPYSALYACAKHVVEAISAATLTETATRVPDSQGQNTLAEELCVLTSRTTSRMEVHEMEVAPPLRLLSCDKRWQHSSKS
jgi:hypothetical protein